MFPYLYFTGAMLKFLTSSTDSSQSASGGTEPASYRTGTDEPASSSSAGTGADEPFTPSTGTDESHAAASGSTSSPGPVQPALSSTDTGEEQAASATIHTTTCAQQASEANIFGVQLGGPLSRILPRAPWRSEPALYVQMFV